MNIDSFIEEEIEKHQYDLAISELTSHNKGVFLRVMNKYIENPKNSNISKVFLENLDTFAKSVLTLRKSNEIPNTEQLLDLNDMLSGLGEYLDVYGYSGSTQEKVRRIYLVLSDYLKNLPKRTVEHSETIWDRPSIGYGERDEHRCIIQFEKWNPLKAKCVPIDSDDIGDMNYVYMKYYHKVFDENVARVKRGLSVLNREDYETELSEVEELAYEDAVKSIHFGESMLGSRGDLNTLERSRGEESNRKILSASNRVIDRVNEERVKTIQHLEGLSETQLSEDTWLSRRIIELIKKRR